MIIAVIQATILTIIISHLPNTNNTIAFAIIMGAFMISTAINLKNDK